ncbi:hypothetical protein M0R72_06700 [Candidatus Pacearchaeota archaeon]|jgi:hypothetical protein|nr:hypothetical protein [Candidatus Pacearchaeota archaeon]
MDVKTLIAKLTLERWIIVALAALLAVAVVFGMVQSCRFNAAAGRAASAKYNQDFSTGRVVMEKEYIGPKIAELTTDQRTAVMSNAWRP